MVSGSELVSGLMKPPSSLDCCPVGGANGTDGLLVKQKLLFVSKTCNKKILFVSKTCLIVLPIPLLLLLTLTGDSIANEEDENS